jgi:DNA processing protein
MKKEVYHIWLSQAPGITPRGAWYLYKEFQNIEKIYQCQRQEIIEYFQSIEGHLGSGFINNHEEDAWERYKEKIVEIETYYNKIREKNIEVLLPEHENFPKRLVEIDDCPIALYAKGNVQLPEFSIGIVGSRRASDYGKAMAKYFAKELARRGINVVSGLAYGIDVHAHMGCIEDEQYTTAVLGGGLHECYPKRHEKYFQEIQKCGCILSEEPYGRKVQSYMFPKRNRIISGMSDGIVVIEAAKKSGSLITSDYALEQGRDVLAVPGRLFDKSCEGSNHLIKQGAKPIFDVNDILDELGIIMCDKGKIVDEFEKKLEEKENIVYSCISYDPVHVDQIVHQIYGKKQDKCILEHDEIMIILLSLELKGFIEKKSGCYYTRLEV